jgi:hypothetical protein
MPQVTGFAGSGRFPVRSAWERLCRGLEAGLVGAVAVLAALLVTLAAGRQAEAADSAYRVDDASLVYLGNPRQFKKPCVVNADVVYRAIPEYQEILRRNLTDRDVPYHFLMKKASEKFAKAISDVSRDLGYDLVAGVGAVSATASGTPPPPDETQNTISRLPA